MEGERKLVTVLFADVANYTATPEKLDRGFSTANQIACCTGSLV